MQTAILAGPFLSACLSVRHVHVRYMLLPVRLSVVCRLSVTFVHPTQAIEIFGNVSTPSNTLAIC